MFWRFRALAPRPTSQNSDGAPPHSPSRCRASFGEHGEQSPADLEIWSQDAFKNGAGTASSPRLVIRTEFYGDEPCPPLLADFLERALCRNSRPG